MQFGWKHGITTLGLVSLIAVGLLLGPGVVVERTQMSLNSPWFPVVLVGLYLVRPFLAWPISALSALVGYQYGILYGVPIAILGAVGSTFIAYAGTRYLEFDSGVLGWATEESEHFFSSTGGLRGVIAARVAPVPAEATSLAAGAADVRPGKYVLDTAIGEIPWAFAAVTIGHSMYQLTLSDVSFSPWLIGATAIAAIIILAGPVYRFFQHTTRGGHIDGTSRSS